VPALAVAWLNGLTTWSSFMSSTIAMYTGLTGLTANARNLDVVGNNIANVNTTGYKSNRLLFATQFSRNFRLGSAPGDTSGGANPTQIGLGVNIAGTQRSSVAGSTSATGSPSDLALTGDGLFIVERGATQLYTRAGSFSRNNRGELVSISGDRVMGWGVDGQFQIDRGALRPLSVPLGVLTVAEATTRVEMSGALRAGTSSGIGNSQIAEQGSMIELGPLTDATGAISDTSLLVNVRSGGNPIAAAGESIRLRDVIKGDGVSQRRLSEMDFEVTATTTVAEFNTWLENKLGIRTDLGANPSGETPGVTLDATTGTIRINGNTGVGNDISLSAGNLLRVNGTAVSPTGIAVDKTQTADGESTFTRFNVIDSLGNQVSVEVTMTLVERVAGDGVRFRYDILSYDDSDQDPRITSGVLQYDNLGNIKPNQEVSATINRANSGAVNPLTFTIDFSLTNAKQSANQTASTIAMRTTDGSPAGTLSSFAIGSNGIITGAFSNGLTRTIGQVALATFANPAGLVEVGDNTFDVGANSGVAVISAPGDQGTGAVLGGALELSNVDLSAEFINLIVSSTGYSASSRLISTTDQLLQQLLVIGRG
jgi:flagellar hook protein FlgE